jgi:hypothetical protein
MCECEFVYPSVQSVVHRKAIIQHVCGECDRFILPNELYRVDRVLTDGEWGGSKTCRECEAIVWWVRDQTDCCVAFGELREVLEELGLVDFEEGTVDSDAIVLKGDRVLPSPWVKIAFEIVQERNRVLNRSSSISIQGYRAAYKIDEILKDV